MLAKITIYSVVVRWLRDERSEVVAMHVIKICPDHNLVPREDPGNEVTPIKYSRVENENADCVYYFQQFSASIFLCKT